MTKGFGIKFLIEGFKKVSIFLSIFLIDKSLAVISSRT